MLKEFRPAIVLLLAFTVLTGVVYPLVMTGLANVIFPIKRVGAS
jgi:K+-transporting ATPase ATPase C chain